MKPSPVLLLACACAACSSTRSPKLETPVGAAHSEHAAGLHETDIFAEAYPDTDPSAIADLADTLAPYGSWSTDPRLGVVWTPSRAVVGERFVPYASAGRWTWGQSEWVWVSDYAWGWLPFHYGRWAQAGQRGWVWIPGRRYAGAWVVWRTGNDWVGWGPEPPSWYWQEDGEAVRVQRPQITGFVYARPSKIFDHALAANLAGLSDALDAATHTRTYDAPRSRANLLSIVPAAPSPSELGVADLAVAPPTDDPGLQRAWLLARPSNARAAGYGPRIDRPHLKEWVADGPRWVSR